METIATLPGGWDLAHAIRLGIKLFAELGANSQALSGSHVDSPCSCRAIFESAPVAMLQSRNMGQMGWFTRNSRPTCTSKVSELAEGIKALKAANNVEAAPQRIGQRQSSAKEARVIPPRKSTASQSTSLIKPQVSSLPAVYRAVTADGP